MKLVVIESPYKGDVARNTLYLRHCIRDCINREESPYASHRMLTDALNDNDPVERAVGIAAGLAWRKAVQAVFRQTETGVVASFDPVLPVFYLDLGWSDGMTYARKQYDADRITYEERKLRSDDPFFVQASLL